MTALELDAYLAKKYVNKVSKCATDDMAFELTFAEFKKVMTAKRCKYTDVLLTYQRGVVQIDSDVTIDRIDNNKGYVKGNVVACCHGYNAFKAILEHPDTFITFELLHKAVAVQVKLMGRCP